MNKTDGRIGTVKEFLYDAERANAYLDCPVYQYARPALTTDMVVFDVYPQADLPIPKVNILLITRGNQPFQGMRALPGGYVNIDETAKDASIRELQEETGLTVDDDDVYEVGFFDGVDRNPLGRVLSMAYWCYNPVGPEDIPVAGDDAIELGWYDIYEVLSGRVALAFDHEKIVNAAYSKILKNILFKND